MNRQQIKFNILYGQLRYLANKTNADAIATHIVQPKELEVSNPARTTFIRTRANSHLRSVVNYIEQISHMNDVRQAQAQVLKVKTELMDVGNKKRFILKQLDEVHAQLHNIYKDMKFPSSRASAQYLELVKSEVDLYEKEKTLQDNFKEADQHEQYLFSQFSMAINDSYEKEKMHTNFVKVFGFIGTIVGSFLTLMATLLANYYNQSRFYALRDDVETTVTQKVIAKLDSLHEEIAKQKRNDRHESWGSYLNRHTRWIYGWAMPKK